LQVALMALLTVMRQIILLVLSKGWMLSVYLFKIEILLYKSTEIIAKYSFKKDKGRSVKKRSNHAWLEQNSQKNETQT